jgi:hypothetical protein
MFFEEKMIEKVLGFIAILAVFPACVADGLLFRYLLEPEKGTAWLEITLFISFIMLLIGLVTLFAWEAIFLDRKDYLSLMPLPIAPFLVFTAKFISLVMFIGLFVIGINSLSSIVFAVYLGQSKPYGLTPGLLLLFTHILVMLAAGSFIFFVLAIIFGLLNVLLKGRFFSWLSDIIRLGLIIGQLFLIYHFLINHRFIKIWFENVQALKSTPTPFIMNFPPLWFTGLYQTLMGNHDAFFQELADRSLLALAVSILAFFLITLISYGRYLKNLSPESARVYRPSRLKRILEPCLNLIFLRNSVERAAFHFYGSAMSRSRIHRTRLMSYLGVGAGIALIFFVSTGNYFWKYRSGNMLSLPLVLNFFLLVGLMDAISIPINYEANWVFRIIENRNGWAYFSALRKSTLCLILLPLYISLFAFYCFFWGWPTAGLHCLYDLAFAVLLMEGLLFRRIKFPFACSCAPGKSRLYFFWFPYLGLFLAYIYMPRWMEPYFMEGGRRFIIFYGFAILAVIALRLYHKLFFYPRRRLIYEESPEPLILELFHAY